MTNDSATTSTTTPTVGSSTSSYMRQAVAQADRVRGRTSPNPAVGAVIVRPATASQPARVVGEGATQPPGGPHAEIVALRQAGDLARGATLYTTLEPCCHYGRTPPCADALIAAGITEAHIAILDPNPSVQGGGCQRLEDAGVRLVLGEDAAAARELIEDFSTYMLKGRPFVHAKWAMTLDGKIATASGESKWITGPAARQRGHQLRDTVGAILVGVGTVLADDPELTVRLAPNDASSPRSTRPAPWRIVVDSHGRTPLGARLLSPELAIGTIIATTEAAPAEWRREVARRGAQALILPEVPSLAASNVTSVRGQVDLSALLAELARGELTSVLVEGGGTLLGSLFAAKLVDKIHAFIAPSVFGGSEAPSPVGGPGVPTPADAWRLSDIRVEHVGDDLLVIGYPIFG